MPDDLPALLGGKPIRPQGPPNWPFPDPAVQAALAETFANGSWGQYLGPNVPRLETLLAESHEVRHALACATGSLAVEIALRSVGVGPGDEVLMAAYDFEPSFLAIHAIGALPVLVDVSPANASFDPDVGEAAVTPSTKAIFASHLHGGLIPMSRLMAIAARHNVPVVEDASQATGATVEGRAAGTWGDVGVLSFGGSKLLTAGRGGAILTNDDQVAQRARLARGRGIQQWAALSELQAAVLIPQVLALPERTLHREAMVTRLLELVRDVPGLSPFRNEPGDIHPAYYKVGFFLDSAASGISRDIFVKAMRAEGIAMDAGFRALHLGRAAHRYKAPGPLPNAESASETIVALHHPVLSLGIDDVEQVASAVWKTYRNAARLR